MKTTIQIPLLLAMGFLVSGGAFNALRAQDPSFTQFYANPVYLNPALAGTSECGRILFQYRNQWPQISGGFKTYSFSADKYIPAISGGLGLVVFADDAGGMISTINLGGVYAYRLKLSSSANLHAGFEVSYLQQKLNWDELIFSDMIDYTSGSINTSGGSEMPPDRLKVSALDFSSGLALGIREKYYFGLAVHHLTQPDLDYYSTGTHPLNLKITLHGGAQFVLSEGDYRSERGKLILNPNVLYQQQQEAKQLNAGFNIEYMPMVAGIWYRHNLDNPDGMIFLVGLKQKRFKFGYSYDLTMSKLKGSSGGGHELSFTLLAGCGGKRNRPGAIKCPEF